MRSFIRATVLGAVSILALGAAAQAKTLVYCSEGSPEGFAPMLFTSGTTFDASSKPVYNRLVEFERGDTKTVPGLAESYTVSDDGLTYTFKLREGVKWHGNKNFTPSRDFNADDVVFTFMRQLDPNHPYNKVSGGTYEYFASMDMGNLLKTVEKVDDHTVKFTLAAPQAPFIANIAMDFASIMSAEYADAMMKAGTPEKLDLEPIGTGLKVHVAGPRGAGRAKVLYRKVDCAPCYLKECPVPGHPCLDQFHVERVHHEVMTLLAGGGSRG